MSRSHSPTPQEAAAEALAVLRTPGADPAAMSAQAKGLYATLAEDELEKLARSHDDRIRQVGAKPEEELPPRREGPEGRDD